MSVNAGPVFCLGQCFALGRRFFFFAVLLILAGLARPLRGAEAADPRGPQPPDPRLQKFFAAKEQHARSLAKELKTEVAPDIWAFFEAGTNGDWTAVRKLWRELSARSGQYRGQAEDSVRTIAWSPVLEAELAYECFTAMDMKFVELFARDTIAAIPRDSIYFGGTDPGRGVITAFCKSHALADPFFVLTQNGLADATYLAYLRATFGKRIALPSDDDSHAAFDQYKSEAEERLDQGKLKPGERVSRVNGEVQMGGQVSVMAINGLLAKLIFDRNPGREFYVEESFPLEWMYPHLAPHGPILKVNRQPLSALSEAALQADREYWQKLTARFLGDWLTETTSIQTVCEFVERVYGDAFLNGFKGDPDYVLADRSHSPRRHFGKLRQAQAGLYEWRLARAATPGETSALKRAAELAFKQLLALCPDDSEYVRRYASWLKDQKRVQDARRVVEAGLRINPGSKRLSQLAAEFQGN